MSLEAIGRFSIPKEVVQATEEALRRAGRKGFELFVLWSGVTDGSVFYGRTCHIPDQTGYRLESGVCVRVEGSELHRLNRWLFERDETLAVQIHTHPTNAYHSDTDSTYPIVTVLGGLSIVVPDFCRRGLIGDGTAMYRLQARGWVEVPALALGRLLDIGS